MKYCTRCGAQLPDDAEFCNQCGTKTKQETFQTENNPQQVSCNEGIQALSNRILKLWIASVIIILVAWLTTLGTSSSKASINSNGKIPAGTYFNPTFKNEITFNKDGTYIGSIGLDLSFSSDTTTKTGDYVVSDNKLILDLGHKGMLVIYNYLYTNGKLMLWSETGQDGMIYYSSESWEYTQ